MQIVFEWQIGKTWTSSVYQYIFGNLGTFYFDLHLSQAQSTLSAIGGAERESTIFNRQSSLNAIFRKINKT